MRIASRLSVLLLFAIITVLAGDVFHRYRRARPAPVPVRRVPHIKWTRVADPLFGASSPPTAAKDGTLYVATSVAIHALDPSGAERFVYRLDTADRNLVGSLVLDEADNLYFDSQKSVYSLAPSGLKRWEADCPRGALALNADAPFDPTAIYTTCDARFAAFNKRDGQESWRLPNFVFQSSSVVPSSPVMLHNGELIFSRDQQIYATDRHGNPLWTYPPDPLSSTYLLGVGPDDTIYARRFSGELVVLNSQGSVRWSFREQSSTGFNESPVTAPDGTLYVIAAQGPLFALAPDGTLKWKFALPPSTTVMGYTAPVLGSDGRIYQALEDRVIALSPQGKMLWQLQLPGEARHRGFLTLAPDGTLYCVMDNSFVHAIETGN